MIDDEVIRRCKVCNSSLTEAAKEIAKLYEVTQ